MKPLQKNRVETAGQPKTRSIQIYYAPIVDLLDLCWPDRPPTPHTRVLNPPPAFLCPLLLVCILLEVGIKEALAGAERCGDGKRSIHSLLKSLRSTLNPFWVVVEK